MNPRNDQFSPKELLTNIRSNGRIEKIPELYNFLVDEIEPLNKQKITMETDINL